MLEFKARRLRLLLQERSTTEKNFIRPSELKQKTTSYSHLNSSVRCMRPYHEDTRAKISRVCAAPSSLASSIAPLAPSSVPPVLRSASARATTATRIPNKTPLRNVDAVAPPRPIVYKSSSVNEGIARIGSQTKAEQKHNVARGLSYPTSGAISWAPNNRVYSVPSLSPRDHTQQAKVGMKAGRQTSTAPAHRLCSEARSSHQSSLLRCRQRLVLQQVRRLGRQRQINTTTVNRGPASTPQESLIRPSQINGERTNGNGVTHFMARGRYSKGCLTECSRPSRGKGDGPTTQEEMPFDQMSDELEARARRDPPGRGSHTASEGTKACLRDGAKTRISTGLEERGNKRRSASAIPDWVGGTDPVGGSGNVVDRVICEPEDVRRATPEEASNEAEVLIAVGGPMNNAFNNKAKANLDENDSVASSDGEILAPRHHGFDLSRQIGGVTSRHPSEGKDDGDVSSSWSTTRASNVLVMMPRDAIVSFHNEERPAGHEAVDRRQCNDNRTEGIEDSSPVKTLQPNGVIKKISMWRRLNRGSHRIPLICGRGKKKPPLRKSATATTACSSSSDRSSCIAAESRSTQLARETVGVASVGTSHEAKEESAKTAKSPKHQLGRLLCVLPGKEGSEWHLSEKADETSAKKNRSVMEMVFFD